MKEKESFLSSLTAEERKEIDRSDRFWKKMERARVPRWQRILLFWGNWLPESEYTYWRWYHHLIALIFLPLFIFYVFVAVIGFGAIGYFLWLVLEAMTNQML